jgi:hypothetical protein
METKPVSPSSFTNCNDFTSYCIEGYGQIAVSQQSSCCALTDMCQVSTVYSFTYCQQCIISALLAASYQCQSFKDILSSIQ